MAGYILEDHEPCGHTISCMFCNYPAEYVVFGMRFCSFHAAKEWLGEMSG